MPRLYRNDPVVVVAQRAVSTGYECGHVNNHRTITIVRSVLSSHVLRRSQQAIINTHKAIVNMESHHSNTEYLRSCFIDL